MKKLKLILALLFINLFIFVPSVQAKVIVKQEDSVVIEKSEVITDDLFIAADTVDILGTINGDVYVAAGEVDFSGTITGDLLIGSGQVSINGQISDDLMVGAGNVMITDSTIGGSLIVGAGSVTINDQSKINGSLLAGTGLLDNQASVLRNLMVGAGKVKHNAPVGGEAFIGGEKLELGPQTVINGNLTYTSEKDLQLDNAAIILGETNRHFPQSSKWNKQQFKLDISKDWQKVSYSFHILSFFSSLIVGLVILMLFKTSTLSIARNIKSKFFASLGWGLILLLLTFPAVMLLAVTGVGFPLAAILSILFIIELYLAKIFTAMAIGNILDSYFDWKKTSPQILFSLGLLILYFLRLVPGIGGFVRLLSLLSGLGGLWLYKKKLLNK